MVTNEDRDALNDLFLRSDDDPKFDSPDDILETPTLVIDLDEVEGQAKAKAQQITERLSNYYFDPKYIQEHPYIPNKIAQEMDQIRMLLKMQSVNEKAQDTLIQNITMNAGKGALYTSLTALQKSMLDIQKQLNDIVSSIESIFKEMQDNADKTFAEKPKETNLEDGSIIVRGSKEFIESLANRDNKTSYTVETIDGEKVDTQTGEILAEDMLKEMGS
ncbi:MAG: hypothetical protein IJH39_07680 [Clostridia bacterium]|nr:hypothetical protein [Clostridia bacterium]